MYINVFLDDDVDDDGIIIAKPRFLYSNDIVS